MSETPRVGFGDGECYCQPDIGWTCHHHENAPVPHSPNEDERAIKAVLALRHRENGRHSCTCSECRAIVRIAVMARERIAMGSARKRTRQKHRDAELGAALRAALASLGTYGVLMIDRDEVDGYRVTGVEEGRAATAALAALLRSSPPGGATP